MAKYTFRKLLPSRDFFSPHNDHLDYAFIDRCTPIVELASKYFRPTYHGLDNIPRDGAALLVGNHGIIGFDALFIFVAIYRATGRMPRGLGDYHLFVEPVSRRFWSRVGIVLGDPEVALSYLQSGHLVNVYPGGARDALKGADARYRLHWDESLGFVRLAMRADVPVVLHMGVGTDDTYRIWGRMGWTGRVLGHAKYGLPLYAGWGPLPRPVKFDYYLSEPIALEGGPDEAQNDAIVRRNHRTLWDRGHAMLRSGLARRRSIWTG
ncbi:MAG: acyltransferase family protein [Polyangiaceae bacterium]|jgi:1-acyl-sn-glycerol-3-phosphate acyltransferase|nr:acyltransferase family protein [Polyangiaceae bacterium]